MDSSSSESVPDSSAELESGSRALAKTAHSDGDPDEWRDELAAKLNRYRARRKPAPPRYPSLTLPFGPNDRSPQIEPDKTGFQTFDVPSNQAVALDQTYSDFLVASPRPEAAPQEPEPVRSLSPQPGAKIIEFPRFAWGPPAPPADQLAEPVGEQLRILEVPEETPAPPALGGITIEPVPSAEPERRPGLDFPLQSAPLARRLAASLIDALIVASASALFGYLFWEIAAVRPPKLQLLSLAAAIPYMLWAAYQYLLVVYSGSTPGLRALRLELARFDGSSVTRSLRRWRVLASYLSALSLGMGYAWVFLDEDSLCWHDRITHTYLAPRKL